MDPLTAAHIDAKLRLQRLAAAVVAAVWDRLPHYDRQNVDQFLSTALPLAHGANLQAVALTDAYVARALERQPVGVDAQQIVAGIRNGTTPETVYTRAFIAVWSALGEGKPFAEAVALGRQRATTAAATDVQLAFRDTLPAIGARAPVMGWQRVADPGACPFCTRVDGAIMRVEQPMPLHPHCVAGDTLVSAPTGVRAVTRRRYAGEIVILRTAAGHELTVTPNHPILTRRGWVAAGLLREGDDVVSSRGRERIGGRVPDEEDMPARIEDRFRAGRMASAMASVSVPFAAEQFHGDAGDGEVDVVAADGRLDADALAALLEPREQRALAVGLGLAAGLSCECGRAHRLFTRRAATLRGMRRSGARLAFADGLPGGGEPVLLGGRAQLNTAVEEVPRERAAIDAETLRQSEYGRAGLVELDRVAEARRVSRAHLDVYNLVTRGGWYIANGVYTHNCGCTIEPIELSPGRPAVEPTPTPDDVAVHEHGELGPLLAAPGDHFAGPAAVAA